MLGHLKKYEEAEILSRQAWCVRRRMFGHEDSESLRSQLQLGWLLGYLKRNEEAEVLDRDTWQVRQRVLGECSLKTLRSLLNLS